MIKSCITSVLLVASISWISQVDASDALTVDLWPDGPPQANGLSGPEHEGGCIGNISKATLTVYHPPKEKANGAAVLVTPGGGYRVVCMDTEGRQIADWLTARGITAIVLKYRLPNGHHTIPSSDARRAIRTIRHRAEEWKLSKDRIGIWGFSAGGHLASTVSTQHDLGNAQASDPIDQESCRPSFSILFYPVISMMKSVTHGGSQTSLLGAQPTEALIKKYSNQLQVSESTPATFLLHATDDRVVSIDNALAYHSKLVAHGVAARMLVYENRWTRPDRLQIKSKLGSGVRRVVEKTKGDTLAVSVLPRIGTRERGVPKVRERRSPGLA